MTPELTLQVRSPAELLTAVPYLLGFHPTDSLVLVALRARKVLFSARHDLPPAGVDELDARAGAADLAAIVARQSVDSATVIGYGEPARVTPTVLRAADALRRVGVHVDDIGRVTDGRYWSYLCDVPGCCPAEGTPFAPEQNAVAAAATYAGAVALPDREALLAQVGPVTGAERESMTAATARAQARLADLMSREMNDTGFARLVRRAGRTAVRDAERRYRSRRRLTDDETAWLGVLLIDRTVRDYAWERTGADEWRVQLWTDVARRMENGYVPAPACLLAFAAWRLGDGALARAAVERALDVERDYSMAVLLGQVLGYGLSPSMVDGWPLVDRLELGDTPRFDPGEVVPPFRGGTVGHGRHRRHRRSRRRAV